MTLEFFQAAEADKKYLLQLRKQTMTQHLERTGQYLSDEQHANRVDYEFACSHIVFHQGVRIGFAKFRSTPEELEIIQVQVDPKQQRKGYGTDIIMEIMQRRQAKTLKLTVLKGNPAVDLYTRLGFKIVREDNYEYHMHYMRE